MPPETTTPATTQAQQGASAAQAPVKEQSDGAPAKPTDKSGTAASAGSEAKGYWPDDWASRLAKGDDKRAKDLGKFQSPEAIYDAYSSLQRRLGSGEFRAVLPKNPTEADLAAWRKDNGIPDKPDGYKFDGVEIPESDREDVAAFAERMHKVNASQEVAREAVRAYYEVLAKQESDLAERDEAQRHEALDALNAEWGASFRRNINVIQGSILSKFPESVRDALMSARLPDGTAIFNNPDVIRGLAALALEVNPAGVVAHGGTGDIAKGMLDEYKEIQKLRQTNRGAYNKDEKLQARERTLIEAMVKNGIMDANGNIVERRAA